MDLNAVQMRRIVEVLIVKTNGGRLRVVQAQTQESQEGPGWTRPLCKDNLLAFVLSLIAGNERLVR